MVALPDLPVPGVEPGQVRDAVADVLAQEEYAELRPGLLDRLWELVRDGLGRLLELVEGTGTGGVLGAAILAVVVLALVVLIVRALRRVRRAPSVDEPRVGVAGRSAGQWLADAHAAEAAGRHREAVRSRYRALVAELAAAGLVEEMPGRTTGEYRREVAAAAPGAAKAFDAASMLFERAWYAREPVGATDAADMARVVDATARAAGLGRLAGAGSRS